MFRALGPRSIPIPTPLLSMVSQTNDGAGDAVGVRGPAITRSTGHRASPGKQAAPLSPLDLPLSVSPPPYTDLASTDPFSRVYGEAARSPLSWVRHEADVQFDIISSSAQREEEEGEGEEEEVELEPENAGGKGKERGELDFFGTVETGLPDILDDTLDDKDFEYAIQLQIEELQKVAHEFEDEKMARRLAVESGVEEDPTPRYNLRSRGGVESVVQEDPSPRYNLRPRPSRTGTVPNTIPGPSSRAAAPTRNSINKKT